MEEQKFFTYKGLPLVRNGKQIFYGNMSDETVAMLQIMSTRNVNGLEVADRVKVWLTLTQVDGVDASEIMKKTCERKGLYIAYIWLEREKQGA